MLGTTSQKPSGGCTQVPTAIMGSTTCSLVAAGRAVPEVERPVADVAVQLAVLWKRRYPHQELHLARRGLEGVTHETGCVNRPSGPVLGPAPRPLASFK